LNAFNRRDWDSHAAHDDQRRIQRSLSFEHVRDKFAPFLAIESRTTSELSSLQNGREHLRTKYARNPALLRFSL
jgi:hypothetical protein